MAQRYDVSVQNIGQHIKKTLDDGKQYDTKHCNLQMIVAVGFKVNNERADATKEHMGMATWESALDGKIVKAEVSALLHFCTEENIYAF